MMQNNIYILSDAVHSGKSTLLLQLCKFKKSVTGFICADIDSLRHIIDIENNQTYPFQKSMSDNANDVMIGNYIFDNNGFITGQKIINSLLLTQKEFIIIDEIGKLELAEQGFEPELGRFLNQTYLLHHKTIVLVIRDYLLERCIAKYNLQQAVVFNINLFKSHFEL
jgi:nucleoside-triphosphatase THEP1